MKTSFINRLSNIIQSLFKSLIITSDQLLARHDKTSRFACVLLNRNHYSEVHRSYPITDLYSLKKVLKNEYASKVACHYITEPSSNQTRVISFVLIKDLVEVLPSTTFILPESLILWVQLKREYASSITKIEGEGYSFFLSLGDMPLSQMQSRFCETQDAFRINNGIPEGWMFFEPTNINLKYVNIVKGLGARHLFSFIHQSAKLSLKFDRKWIILSGSIIGAYLLMVWVYLSVSLDRKQQQLVTTMEKASAVLGVVEHYEETNQALSLLTERLSSSVRPDIYIELLHYLIAKKVELSTFSKTDQSVLLRGEVNSATTLLMEIKELPYMADAVFDSPVSRDNEKDRFVIRARLKNPVIEIKKDQDSPEPKSVENETQAQAEVSAVSSQLTGMSELVTGDVPDES